MMSGDHVHLEGHRFFEAGGDLFFIVKAIDDRIPSHLLPQFAKDLYNLPIFWRHQTPQKEGFEHQPSFGKVVAAKEYPGGVMAMGRLYGSSEMPEIHTRRRALINFVKKAGQMGVELNTHLVPGVSSTYDSISKNFDRNEAKVVEVHPFELSVTPWPACNSCVIRMSEQPKKTVENDKLEQKTTEAIEDALRKATVEELTELLNKKNLELEAEKKKAEDVEKDAKKKSCELEDKVKVLEDKVGKLVTELEAEKKAKVEVERAPFVSKLKELDKNGLFDVDIIAAMSIEKMKDKIAKLTKEQEATAKIVVTSMQHSATENQKKEDPPTAREALLKKMESCEKGTAIYKHYEEELAKLK